MTGPGVEHTDEQAHQDRHQQAHHRAGGQRHDAGIVEVLGHPRHDNGAEGHLGTYGQVDLTGDNDQTHTIGNNALHGGVAQHVQNIARRHEHRLHDPQCDDEHHQQQFDHVVQQEVVGLFLGKQAHFWHFYAHSIFPPMQSA